MRDDFSSALAARVRSRPGDPIVTYADAATGERTELSAVSLANAAAKIGNAVLGEFDLAPGDVIGLALPAHWQLAAWCAGAWTAGCAVALGAEAGGAPRADLVVSSPANAPHCVPARDGIQVASMHPFGLPIAQSLPAGCHDVTIVVRQQPDAFLHPPAGSEEPALVSAGGSAVDQAGLMARARELGAQWGLEPGGRLLVACGSGGAGLSGAGLAYACVAVPVACDASAVIVHADDQTAVERLAEQERVSARAALSR